MLAKILGENYEKEIRELSGFDRGWYKKVKTGWDQVAKPLDSLGAFEDILSRIGAIQRKRVPDLSKARLLVCCADNGIVEEGVSQSGQEITAICAESIAGGNSSVAIMARQADVEVLTVDVGVSTERKLQNVRDEKIRLGTRNFRHESAMTEEEAAKALQVGMELVKESKKEGCAILGVGEMGIGNTTTSSAITAALLGMPVGEVTGRGAGLSDEGLRRKQTVIEEALKRYGIAGGKDSEWQISRMSGDGAFKVLQCVGGYDIACMAGICLGGALYQIPIVLDGFISLAAALIACRIEPIVKEYLIPSHSGKEPAMKKLEEELGLEPVLFARMALGEGTGAVLMIQLLRTVNAVYEKSVSFEKAGIKPYRHF